LFVDLEVVQLGGGERFKELVVRHAAKFHQLFVLAIVDIVGGHRLFVDVRAATGGHRLLDARLIAVIRHCERVLDHSLKFFMAWLSVYVPGETEDKKNGEKNVKRMAGRRKNRQKNVWF